MDVFQLVPELDAGPILASVEEPIGRFATSGVVLDRLAALGAGVLVDAVNRLAAGTAAAVPQIGAPISLRSSAPPTGVLDWTRAAEELDRRIRALTPEPGASTRFQGSRFKILDASVAHGTPSLAPGAIRVDGRRVLVGTGSTPLELRRVHPAGKTAMPALDWARGRSGELVLG